MKKKKKREREIKQIADFGNDSIDFFSRMVSLFFERRRGNFIFDLGHCPPDQLLPPPRSSRSGNDRAIFPTPATNRSNRGSPT